VLRDVDIQNNLKRETYLILPYGPVKLPELKYLHDNHVSTNLTHT